MNRVLEKILVRRAIGVCESGDTTFVTEVGSNMLGGSTVVQKEYNNGGTHGAEAIARALKEHLDGRVDRDQIEIGVAVPGMRCYCMSREAPAEAKEQAAGDNSDLSSVLRTAMAQQPDQYVVERSTATFNNRQYNTTVACGRAQLEEISSAISSVMTISEMPLFQPAPWAVACATLSRNKPPKTQKPWILLHLDQHIGLAILMCRTRPMGWREFNVPLAQAAAAARQAVLRLSTYAKSSLVLEMPDIICIEGEPTMVASTASDLENSGFTVIKREQPVAFGKDASQGVALARLEPSLETCDLATSLRPPAKIREIIPWGDIALTCVLLVVLWFALNSRLITIQNARDNKRIESDHRLQELGQPPMGVRSPIAALQMVKDRKMDGNLQKKATDLTSQLKEYAGFYEGRERWSLYLEALPDWIPIQTHLSTFRANTPPPWCKPSEAKNRSISMVCISDVDNVRELPDTLPQMLDGLRKQPLLRKNFPDVQLAAVHWTKEGRAGHSSFSVACFPVATPKGGKSEKKE